jgi:hypothetical protein
MRPGSPSTAPLIDADAVQCGATSQLDASGTRSRVNSFCAACHAGGREFKSPVDQLRQRALSDRPKGQILRTLRLLAPFVWGMLYSPSA